jgi:hypothetical protein
LSQKKEKIDKEELQSIVSALVEDAVNYVDGTLSPARAKATEYWLGLPFGNEEEGRSQFVHTVVRDNIRGVIPDIMRVIFGPERVVEFSPNNPKKIEEAAQQSDYIQYVFAEDNPGFMNVLSVLTDGMVRKLGIFKWGWDDTTEVNNYSIEDIAESQLALLLTDENVELLRLEEHTPGSPAVTAPLPPQAQQAPAAPQDPSAPPQQGVVQPAVETTYNAELRHKEIDGRARIWALPPEEFIHNREARDIEEATMVGHRTEKTTGELLSMGVSQAMIDEHGGVDTGLFEQQEKIARDQVDNSDLTRDADSGEANDKNTYCELYVKVDFDGDGESELRRICTIGPTYKIIPSTNKPVKRRPFSVFCPVPEPHTMSGQSWADLLMDLQKFESGVIRANSDSLSLSIFPRMGYVEGKVNPGDLMNTEVGGPVRMTEPGVLQVITHPYVGKESFPLLEFMRGIEERRTSQSDGANGLDADALQSTEKAAAGQAVTAAQGQKEMLVRIFAEMALKPLFRGLLELYAEHKPKKKIVALRGKWVEIDPAAWDVNVGVKVNVALGTSLVEKKVIALAGLAAKQELIIQTFGPSNPAVTLAQYVQVLKKATKLQGIAEADSYLNDVDPNWQPPQPAAPPPDPKMLMVQVQQAKVQSDDKKAQADFQIKQAEMAATAQQHAETISMDQKKLDQAREIAMAQLEATTALAATELELKYKTQLAIENLRAMISGDQQTAETERENLRQSQEMIREQQVTDRTHANKITELAITQEHEKHMAQIEASRPQPAPVPKEKAAPVPKPQPIQIDNHIHLPKPGKVKITRDAKTNAATGIESDDSE